MNKTAATVSEPTHYKMIRTTNVKKGWVHLDEVKYVTEDVFRKWTRRQLPKRGDVILTREAPLGEVGLLRTSDRVFLGQRLVSYRADSHKLDNRFLLYAFQGADVQGQIKSLGSGATVEHMRVPDCEKLTLDLPPLAEQRRIASILSAYDDLIENNTRRIAILEEMARRIYEEWFVKFRFPGHENSRMVESELGDVPQAWKISKLGDVIELAYGKALKAEDRKPGRYPVYGSSGIVGWHDEGLVSGPGIIVGRKGNVGSVFWSEESFFPIDTVFYVRTDLPLLFVFYNLQSQNFLNNDAAVPGLSRNQAYALPLIVPTAGLLSKFDEACGPIVALSRLLTRENENLRNTRDLLLPKLISGELDVSQMPEPETLAA
ncbi:MAG: restriction endonuclease subunit S [Rhodocyclaceae bacterium]|nr:restriction endonuclease subunit S [Rhodocyclaceae bacterium]